MTTREASAVLADIHRVSVELARANEAYVRADEAVEAAREVRHVANTAAGELQTHLRELHNEHSDLVKKEAARG